MRFSYLILWDLIEGEYAQDFSKDKGQVEKHMRMALGSFIIQEKLRLLTRRRCYKSPRIIICNTSSVSRDTSTAYASAYSGYANPWSRVYTRIGNAQNAVFTKLTSFYDTQFAGSQDVRLDRWMQLMTSLGMNSYSIARKLHSMYPNSAIITAWHNYMFNELFNSDPKWENAR